MSNSVVYLVTRNSFRQVNPDIPITKTRPPDREDPPDVFEGMHAIGTLCVQIGQDLMFYSEQTGACQ